MLRLYGLGGNYAQIYASQPNVRTAVDTLAREAAVLHMQTYERRPRGIDIPEADIRLDDHPVQRLMDNPAPGMSKFRFWYSLFADLAVYDVAYWWKVRQGRLPAALVRIPPGSIYPQRHPITGEVLFFRLPDGTQLSPLDMVVYWGYDPAVNHGSVAPMETLRRLLAEEYASGMDREARWRNSARKDGVITRDVNSPRMSDDAKEGFLIDLEDSLAGANGSGRPLILQPGMDYKDHQWSPREMEYIEARKLSRTEVAAHFHMPPAMVGASVAGQEPDAATLNYFYTSTLPPWLVRVEHEIEAQLVPEFELTPERQNKIYVEFNLDEKLRGSFEERISILATAAGGPIITVNEARFRENLPPIPGGDLIFVPMNSFRGGGPQASPNSPVETPAQGNEPAGTTPGGGTTVQRASYTDFEAGRAIVLGAEQAAVALDPETTSIEGLVGRVNGKSERLAVLASRHSKQAALGRQVLLKLFDRQKRWVDEGLKRDRWDRELSDDLYGFLYPAVEAVGEDEAKRAGVEFEPGRSSALVRTKANATAVEINDDTQNGAELTEERAETVAQELSDWVLEFSLDLYGARQ